MLNLFTMKDTDVSLVPFKLSYYIKMMKPDVFASSTLVGFQRQSHSPASCS